MLDSQSVCRSEKNKWQALPRPAVPEKWEVQNIPELEQGLWLLELHPALIETAAINGLSRNTTELFEQDCLFPILAKALGEPGLVRC